MIKFSFKVSVFLFLLLSSVAQAGLIELSPGTGIIVCDPNGDACIKDEMIPDELTVIKDQFEWVWASGVNTEFFSSNTLMNPDFHSEGDWRFATTAEELAELATLELSDFTNEDGLIHAALYWNTWLMSVNADQLDDHKVGSQWVSSSHEDFFFETFYVRDIAQVPEPSTIMIFAIALIALSMRKRTIN
jgi:hypothetical protein